MSASSRLAVALRTPNRLALALLLGAAAVSAQNLYPNGDFDHVDWNAGWDVPVGQMEHAAIDPSECPASGSLLGRSVKTRWIEHELSMLGPCVPFDEPTEAAVSFQYRGEIGSLSSYIRVAAHAYPNRDCGGTASDVAAVNFYDHAWTVFSGTLSVPADGSMRLEVWSYGTVPATVWVDEIRVTTRPHLLLDDFDGGGTCRWSASVE